MDDAPDFVSFFDFFHLETQPTVICFCACLCKTEPNARSEMSYVDRTRGAEKTRWFWSVPAGPVNVVRTVDLTCLPRRVFNFTGVLMPVQ